MLHRQPPLRSNANAPAIWKDAMIDRRFDVLPRVLLQRSDVNFVIEVPNLHDRVKRDRTTIVARSAFYFLSSILPSSKSMENSPAVTRLIHRAVSSAAPKLKKWGATTSVAGFASRIKLITCCSG
jgi:hypothetical protein